MDPVGSPSRCREQHLPLLTTSGSSWDPTREVRLLQLMSVVTKERRRGWKDSRQTRRPTSTKLPWCKSNSTIELLGIGYYSNGEWLLRDAVHGQPKTHPCASYPPYSVSRIIIKLVCLS